ncbi:hypothetical protein ACVGW4_05260, partial [Enterobacter hormaechei]
PPPPPPVFLFIGEQRYYKIETVVGNVIFFKWKFHFLGIVVKFGIFFQKIFSNLVVVAIFVSNIICILVIFVVFEIKGKKSGKWWGILYYWGGGGGLEPPR